MIKYCIMCEVEISLDDGGKDYDWAEFDGVNYNSYEEALSWKHHYLDCPKYAGEVLQIWEKEV